MKKNSVNAEQKTIGPPSTKPHVAPAKAPIKLKAKNPSKPDGPIKKDSVEPPLPVVVLEEKPIPIPILSVSPRKINIRLLVETITPMIKDPIKPYTPLIIDPSGNADRFFTYAAEYGGLFVDAKKLLYQVSIAKSVSLKDALEELRKTVVNCMRYGKTLVIAMTNSAVDFNKFTSEDSFPLDLFLEAGQRFKREEYWRKVVRSEDLEHGVFIVRPEFCVVVTSGFDEEDYVEFLADALPLNAMIPIILEQST